MEPRKLELLAPAKNADIGRTAILAGADAVYIGAPSFGARAAATNSIDDIRGLAAFAHKYRARIYVTMNTILFDTELEDARKMVWQLYEAGVDALIVQDMAYLTMDLPPIALHASTQCDIRTPEKASWLAQAGFSQLVLPREFSLEEIRMASEAAGVPVEVFVHGALCVSYSGDCQAGCMAMGRSANRGVCPQMCRLSYEIIDRDGNPIAPAKHYLSLKDLNQSSNLKNLIDAGASSFKIEGRLKDERYVANVTAEYSRLLDSIIANSAGKFTRSSYGKTECSFIPDLSRTFNRGYTSYFLKGRSRNMASIETPKWIGNPIGTVERVNYGHPFTLETKLNAQLANGDGLAYFDSKGIFHGFRLNKAQGQYLYPATKLDAIEPGTLLYRNYDKVFLETFERENSGCTRKISVDFDLSLGSNDTIVITATDERGITTKHFLNYDGQQANTPQRERRYSVFSKLGGTIYRLRNYNDGLGNCFIPASLLTKARREMISSLDRLAELDYRRDKRKENQLTANQFKGISLSYHDNIANKVAEQFYISHGAEIESLAVEVEKPQGETVVMTTRYCLRKELGACLKEKNGAKLPSPIFLKNDSGVYRLDFDCRVCGMKVVKCKGSSR